MNENKQKTLYVVHCIDTEGPLTEDLVDTFKRLKNVYGNVVKDIEPSRENLRKLQNAELNLDGFEKEVSKMLAPHLLQYNNNWSQIDRMLDDALSEAFRKKTIDDANEGWVYSWHCMDHVGYSDNPRRKDLGFGNVFRFYRQKLKETNSECDEINWHYHPLSFSRNPLQCATNYVNSYDVLLESLCRRVIDEGWFPTVNRPGFHTERQDIHMFLEQWIPFDYANQFYEVDDGQLDLVSGRFGDWRRASSSWRGYNPSHDDYQSLGNCRRHIFRCLNVGTRFNELKKHHVASAFAEADNMGSAILAFADHDYRDIRPNVNYVRGLVESLRSEYPSVKVKFSGAEQAAVAVTENTNRTPLKLAASVEQNVLKVRVLSGELFGPQPFLAIKTLQGNYYHDNFDIQTPGIEYTYTFDFNTLPLRSVSSIGVASAGRYGAFDVQQIRLS
ncbi:MULTISPECIES: hypothetical protein [Vibrio]|uniref:hypothetical protein n=1 Tax=Vibrio TaxID=662 RepID=UPI001EB1211C|nr:MULTISPECIES: hypothetical protein [unclassified Vibrio]MDA0120160.1 hypothetical protein [Vibrio sp. T11.5]NRB68619.1 hypothetical protein [Vibrio sp.]